jgi:competence protein ComGC
MRTLFKRNREDIRFKNSLKMYHRVLESPVFTIIEIVILLLIVGLFILIFLN